MEDRLMASKQALDIAAKLWRNPTIIDKDVDPALAKVIADKIDQYLDALFWCGGSADFGSGGQAEEGWKLVVLPLLNEEKVPLTEGEG